MLIIGSCTILYNPEESVLSNLETYSELVSLCVVVDNSDKNNYISENIKKNPKYIYIDMHGNKGIAAALNSGADYLYSQKCDFFLSMDQDSRFPSAYYKEIIELVELHSSTYSVIGLNYNQDIKNECPDIIEKRYWLTSGNFVKMSDFIMCGKFNEKLFIDYVDIELGYRLLKNKRKICYLNGYSLIHKIGNPIEINILGKKCFAMNHSPIRYYYRYRNSYYLFRQDRVFFRSAFLKEVFVNIPKMILFEKNRIEKFGMIIKGLKDAKQDRLGKYNG